MCIPQILAGLAATFVFGLILTWNEFLFALLLTGVDTRTVPVAMARTLGGEVGVDYGAARRHRHPLSHPHLLRHLPSPKPAAARRHLRHGQEVMPDPVNQHGTRWLRKDEPRREFALPMLPRSRDIDGRALDVTIELRQVTKKFDQLTAVDRVDLAVGEGEVLCLLGPSGCGKTTTLRMIAGLEGATSGDILLEGERVNELAARERNVAMSFQFYALYPSLNVRRKPRIPAARRRLERRRDRSARRRDRENLAARSRAPSNAGPARRGREAAGRGRPFDHSRCHLLPVRRSRSPASTCSSAKPCAARSRRCWRG